MVCVSKRQYLCKRDHVGYLLFFLRKWLEDVIVIVASSTVCGSISNDLFEENVLKSVNNNNKEITETTRLRARKKR